MKSNKIFDGRLIAYIYFLIDYTGSSKDKTKIIYNILKPITELSIGYAGFKKKDHLRKWLEMELFDSNGVKDISPYNYSKKRILSAIEASIKKCHKVIPSKPTRIFVFPSFCLEVKDDLSGVSGYAPFKNTIHIQIDPKARMGAVKETLCHEFNHSVVQNYHEWNTILDSLIFEGLSETFREEVIGGNPAPYAIALSVKKSRSEFIKIKKLLNSKNHKLHHSIFFGSKDYARWTGYSIGYL